MPRTSSFHASARFAMILGGCVVLMGVSPIEFAHVKDANIQRPTFSPDGNQISFEANYHERKRIVTHIGEYKTRTHRELIHRAASSSTMTSGLAKPSTSEVVHELSWSPAAYKQYVYSSSNDIGDYDVFLSGGSPIGASEFADGGAQWSPQGTKVVFTSSRTGDGDLYLVDAADLSTAPVRLTSHEGASGVYPTWSPDGKQLVYVAHSKMGDNLWWMPSTQHNPIRITRNKGSQTRPTFSPNGRDVAYYVKNETSGQFDIYVFTIGAPSDPKKIVSDVVPNTSGPVWSPDGRFMVYAKQ